MAVEPPDDDNGDDFMSVTPFPGYMKSVYYSSESQSSEDENDDQYRDGRGYTPYRTVSQRFRF